jgi:hypothetical protein
MNDFQQHSYLRTEGKDKERNYQRVLPYAKQLTELIFFLFSFIQQHQNGIFCAKGAFLLLYIILLEAED